MIVSYFTIRRHKILRWRVHERPRGDGEGGGREVRENGTKKTEPSWTTARRVTSSVFSGDQLPSQKLMPLSQLPRLCLFHLSPLMEIAGATVTASKSSINPLRGNMDTCRYRIPYTSSISETNRTETIPFGSQIG